MIQTLLTTQTTQHLTFIGDKINTVGASLDRSANLMFKGNEDTCQIMLSTGERLQVKIGAVFTKSSRCENLLGAKIDKLMNV